MIAIINDSCFEEIIQEITNVTLYNALDSNGYYRSAYVIFNLSSSLNTGGRLDALIPSIPFTISTPDGFIDEKAFDMVYAKYILENDAAFVQMFMIIDTIYSGGSSIILVGSGEYKDAITESLVKFIQQRYGISPIRMINSIEDWNTYTGNENFSLPGVFNLDIDKERYVQLTTNFDTLIDSMGGD